ncbi:MAG: UbiA family prenyltransferase [Thermoplasmata archaeon]
MTAPPPKRRGRLAEVGKFLEIQNLGLNLPFALAFLLAASNGPPSAWKFLWIVVAFVAARNAGHSFNRWADREQDRNNPRTRDRALVTGRASPAFALALAGGSAALLLIAAYFLNPLALALAPVALLLIFGYSYSKRVTTFTTVVLGLVEAVTPAAIYIAVQATLPIAAIVAVFGMLAWGTAFETVHSLGDLESDQELGLYSIPVKIGQERSLILVPVLHALALGLFAVFGWLNHWGLVFDGLLALMGIVAAVADLRLFRRPADARIPFQIHFLLSTLFLVGTAAAVFGR